MVWWGRLYLCSIPFLLKLNWVTVQEMVWRCCSTTALPLTRQCLEQLLRTLTSSFSTMAFFFLAGGLTAALLVNAEANAANRRAQYDLYGRSRLCWTSLFWHFHFCRKAILKWNRGTFRRCSHGKDSGCARHKALQKGFKLCLILVATAVLLLYTDCHCCYHWRLGCCTVSLILIKL